MILKNNKYLIIIILAVILIIFSLNIAAQDFEKNNSDLELEAEVNSSIIFIISLITILLILFIWEPLPISLIAVLVPIFLVIFGNLTKMSVEEALAGFSNSATITVMAMFVFSAGIQRSGAVQLLGDKISHITGSNPRRQIALISVLTGTTSGIINNTPVVAALIPMVKELGRKTNVSPSKLLIPLSYAGMLGGTLTLIGTSTNLLASQVSDRILGHPFKMFEFTGLGIIVLLIGIIYLLTIGYKIIPARLGGEDDLTDEYEMKSYLTEVLIVAECSFIGKTFNDIFKNKKLDYDIIRIIRDGEYFMKPLDSKTLRVGDHLIIRAGEETMLELVKSKGMKILPEMNIDNNAIEKPLKGETLIEVVVPAHSFLVNKTLTEINFLDRYNCNVLALRRGEEITHQKMSEYRFQPGDLILLLATETTFERLRKNRNFIIDHEYDPNIFDKTKMWISIAILIFFILCVSLNILPVAISALSGAFLMVLTGVINKNDFFNSIDWEVYFLLSGLIPLGMAIEKSGTASYIAAKILSLSSILPATFIAMIIYLATSIMANIIGNNASVLLMLPIAIGTAEQLGANPFAFVLITTFAASAAFASPVGYQTNLMVYSSGGFKFSDFIFVGAPLQLLYAFIVPFLVKFFWGF